MFDSGVLCGGARGGVARVRKKQRGEGTFYKRKEKTKRRLAALNRCGRIDVCVQLNESLMVSSVSDMCTVHDILFFWFVGCNWGKGELCIESLIWMN